MVSAEWRILGSIISISVSVVSNLMEGLTIERQETTEILLLEFFGCSPGLKGSNWSSCFATHGSDVSIGLKLSKDVLFSSSQNEAHNDKSGISCAAYCLVN